MRYPIYPDSVVNDATNVLKLVESDRVSGFGSFSFKARAVKVAASQTFRNKRYSFLLLNYLGHGQPSSRSSLKYSFRGSLNIILPSLSI